MLPRPRFRISLWLAVGIAVGAYLLRSIMRGFDFVPDMPVDLVVAVAFLIVLGGVWYLRHVESSDDPEAGDTQTDDDPSGARER